MKKKNTVLYIISAFSVLSALLLSSCNQSDVGIFYGIETEEKIKDGSLSNSLTIGAMDKLGTELYIAAGKVYKKTSGSTEDWAKCSSPSGYDLCTSLTVFEDTAIYAIWFDTDDADTALFSSTDGNTWTKVSGGFSGDLSLVKSAHSAAADGVMVVSTVTGTNTGNYYTTDDGSSYSLMGVNAFGGHFDIDYDGSDYWFLTNENIYEVSDITALNAITESSAVLDKIDDDEYFGYIYTYDENHVYVNRSYGEFSYYNGSSWDNSVENLSVNVNDMTVFTVNSIPTFFVGTYSLGYYEPDSPGLLIDDLDNPDSDSITCDYSTYNASDLRYAAVLGFFVDGDDFYARTYGEGLWKNIDDSGDRIWQRE